MMMVKNASRIRNWSTKAMLIAGAFAGTLSVPACAQNSGNAGFDAYVQSLWPAAQAQGVSRSTFDRMTSDLRYNPRVIALDRDNLSSGSSSSSAIPAFAPYKARHVDAARINGGRAVYSRLSPLLSRIEAQTG